MTSFNLKRFFYIGTSWKSLFDDVVAKNLYLIESFLPLVSRTLISEDRVRLEVGPSSASFHNSSYI